MNISAIDLNLLTVLDALIKERNVTRAARRVGLSQSATSSALGRLRVLFDDPLFVRTRDGMVPTKRTLAMSGRLEAMLDGVRALLAGSEFDPKSASLTWNVVTSDYTQVLLVPDLVRELASSAPGVTVRVQPLVSDVAEHLVSGDADVVLAPFVRAASGLRIAPLFRDTMTCMVRRGHPLAKKKRPTVRDYISYGHVLVSPQGRGPAMMDTVLAERGMSRRVAAIVPHFLIAPEVIANSDFVTAIPTRAAKRAAADGRFHLFAPPLPTPQLDMSLVWHVRSHDDPLHRWLRQALIELTRAILAG
ncbi:LysR family transcriptional regulator [Pendulispora rubella]|uniref:LysR family transcriptional regulator n=1 Tax=Pendulispora rubella TaxID=2741070 RepID=A0ABZ2KSZ7_9BACT